jgi:hypothetical protein
MLEDAKQIALSGFDTVILAFLHVHLNSPTAPCPHTSYPNFVFNNVCWNMSDLHPIIDALRAPTSSIERVLLSIGGAGCQSDFSSLSTDWPTFGPQLLTLAHDLGIDGFDIDIEVAATPYLPILDNIVSLAVANDLLVTAVPADADAAFLTLVKNHATERMPGNSSGVSWLLLQTYGGGGGDWVSDWSNKLVGVVPDPVGFLSPGAQASSSYGPKDFSLDLKRMKKVSTSNITSAFVWDYRLIQYFMEGDPHNLTLWSDEIQGVVGA